ncbi:uncharacterized protein TM35_000032120 [Trypanosoma theileri]|uniref:Uncharacterized protein n=1 Tax=Trypanosoma theileri TaxID=67003 RepID=A0A1X0P7A5_9TRYP|nr:uncharacterized protein TM35_000032120 [Trypanosoma theileri]ORC92459.1 hypothetical protein TM35_000032120 [Trypanosoma theileri]
MSNDIMEFLESRPLVGFQMDGSHLHNVLRNIIQEMQRQAQSQDQLHQRLADIEDDLRDVGMRQKGLERALASVDPDALRRLQQQLDELDRALDHVARDAKEARLLGDEAAAAAAAAGRGVEDVGRELAAAQQQQDQLQQDMDDLAREVERKQKDLGTAVKELEQEQAQLAEQTQELMRDVDRNDGEKWKKLRDMLDELCERTDRNFRSVEESARAVDAELAHHRSDIDTVQGDVGSLDDKMRQGLSGIAKDVDAKYQMILDLLRNHEKSSLEIEQHLVAAGEALARRQNNKSQRISSGNRGYDQNGSRHNDW